MDAKKADIEKPLIYSEIKTEEHLHIKEGKRNFANDYNQQHGKEKFMGRTLDLSDASMAERYVLWLSSLSADIKLGIIEGLSASLRHAKRKDDEDMSFVEKLSGAWDDGVAIEDKMNEIRNPERSALQREVNVW